jgi:hypothetical protein
MYQHISIKMVPLIGILIADVDIFFTISVTIEEQHRHTNIYEERFNDDLIHKMRKT